MKEGDRRQGSSRHDRVLRAPCGSPRPRSAGWPRRPCPAPCAARSTAPAGLRHTRMRARSQVPGGAQKATCSVSEQRQKLPHDRWCLRRHPPAPQLPGVDECRPSKHAPWNMLTSCGAACDAYRHAPGAYSSALATLWDCEAALRLSLGFPLSCRHVCAGMRAPGVLKEARLSQPSAPQRRVLTRSMSFSLCCPQYAPCCSPGRLYLASVPQPSCWHTLRRSAGKS